MELSSGAQSLEDDNYQSLTLNMFREIRLTKEILLKKNLYLGFA